MFAHIQAKSAALVRWRTALFRKRPMLVIGIVALSLLTGACVTTPHKPFTGPDPSDPRVRVPNTKYRSTIGGYTSQRPVEPEPWREQNERVAPTTKQ